MTLQTIWAVFRFQGVEHWFQRVKWMDFSMEHEGGTNLQMNQNSSLLVYLKRIQPPPPSYTFGIHRTPPIPIYNELSYFLTSTKPLTLRNLRVNE